MPNPLGQPLQGFQDDLDRLRSLLELLQKLKAFGGADDAGADSLHAFVASAIALRNEVRNRTTEFPILSGTLLLYVAGRFENFVRDSFELLCDLIAERCSRLSDLPHKMRSALIQLTAEAVAAPSKFNFDDIEAHSFVTVLAANMSATTGLGKINSRCLSVTTRNMNSTMLAELFKRAGMESVLQEVSKQAPLKAFLQIERDAQAAAEVSARLDKLMKLRNGIAHPTADTTFPDFDQVLEWVAFLKVFGSTLVSVAEVHLAVFRGPAVRVETTVTRASDITEIAEHQ